MHVIPPIIPDCVKEKLPDPMPSTPEEWYEFVMSKFNENEKYRNIPEILKNYFFVYIDRFDRVFEFIMHGPSMFDDRLESLLGAITPEILAEHAEFLSRMSDYDRRYVDYGYIQGRIVYGHDLDECSPLSYYSAIPFIAHS